MARSAHGANLGAVVNKDAYPQTKNAYHKPIGSSLDATTLVADLSSVTSALSSANSALVAVSSGISTLVADGATPTQAHVTTLNTAFGTFNTAQAAVSATTATAAAAALATAINNDVVVSYDTTKITSLGQLKRVVDIILTAIRGDGSLTTN